MSNLKFFNPRFAFELARRNWYVSGLYLLAWLLIIAPVATAINSLSYHEPYAATNYANNVMVPLLVFSVLITLLYTTVAICVNCDYLLKKQSAHFHGALAMKRSKLMLSSYVATVVPGVVVNLVAGILLAGIEYANGIGFHCYPTLICSGVLFVIIHTGFCLFAASLTSTRLMFIILVLMLNGYVFVFDFGVRAVESLFSFGVYDLLDPSTVSQYMSVSVGLLSEALSFNGDVLPNDAWFGFVVYAIISLIATACACKLFNWRHMEHVEDGIAFARLRPFFTIAFSLAFGLGFALVGNELLFNMSSEGNVGSTTILVRFIALYLLGALGSIVVIEGIMAKTIKIVMHRLACLAVLSLLCIGVSVGATYLAKSDSAYVPSASEVANVQVSGVDFYADEADEIAAATHLHQSLVDATLKVIDAGGTGLGPFDYVDSSNTHQVDRIADAQGVWDSSQFLEVDVEFTYELTNGKFLVRHYSVMVTEDWATDDEPYIYEMVTLASSECARQSRVDAWYKIAEENADTSACQIELNATSGYDKEVNSVEYDAEAYSQDTPQATESDEAIEPISYSYITLSGKELKELLDHGLAKEMLTSYCSDPYLVEWVLGDAYISNGDYTRFTRMSPFYYGPESYFGEALEFSPSMTPKTIEWINKQYHTSL